MKLTSWLTFSLFVCFLILEDFPAYPQTGGSLQSAFLDEDDLLIPLEDPNLKGNALRAAIETHIFDLVKAKGTRFVCRDNFNGLKYHCKNVFDESHDAWVTVYLPPYPATMPRLVLRARLKTTGIDFPNPYIAFVPQRFISDGKSALAMWFNLAARGEPFGCKVVVCNIIYRFTGTQEQLAERQIDAYDNPSNVLVRQVLAESYKPTRTSEDKVTALTLCSLYVRRSYRSPPFECIDIARIDNDGSVFMATPLYRATLGERVFQYPPHYDTGGNEDAEPTSLFTVSIIHSTRPAVTTMKLIRNALAKGRAPYDVRFIGHSVIGTRKYLVDEITTSALGFHPFYEDTFIRFDVIPDDDQESTADVDISLVVSHSLDPRPAPEENWHPATAEQLDAYKTAVTKIISDELRLYCDTTDGTTWDCKGPQDATPVSSHSASFNGKAHSSR
jgi:hypothetical protein